MQPSPRKRGSVFGSFGGGGSVGGVSPRGDDHLGRQSVTAGSPRRKSSIRHPGGQTHQQQQGQQSVSQLIEELAQQDGQRAAHAQQKRVEAQEQQLREMEESHARAEERRQEAQLEKLARPKREAGAMRCSLWLQSLGSILAIHSLHKAWGEKKSLLTLRKVFLPMLWRWKCHRACVERRKKNAAEAACLQENFSPPTAADLKKMAFFKDWGAHSLSLLVEAVYLALFEPDDFIVMEGDWGSCMYLIHDGTVEVTLRNPKSKKSKSHRHESRLRLAQITDKSERPFFGEFSILANEPRSASCVALTACQVWVIDKVVVDAVLLTLQDQVRQAMAAIADSRRTQILAKIYPLTADMVGASHPLFRCWSEQALQDIIKKFEAKVCRIDKTVCVEGEPGYHFYIIASGTVSVRQKKQKPLPASEKCSSPKGSAREGMSPRLLSREGSLSPRILSRKQSMNNASTPQPPGRLPSMKQAKPASQPQPSQGDGATPADAAEALPQGTVQVATLEAGTGFGEIALLFLERRTATVTTVTKTDLWQLPKAALMEVLIGNPDWFMAAKTVTNGVRAQRLEPQPFHAWTGQPEISKNIPNKLWREVTARATPKVIESTGRITTVGERTGFLYLLASGTAGQLKEQTHYEPGTILGVPEAFTFQPTWMGTITAETKCELWCISTAHLWELLNEHYPQNMKKLTSTEALQAAAVQHSFPPQSSAVVRELLSLDKVPHSSNSSPAHSRKGLGPVASPRRLSKLH